MRIRSLRRLPLLLVPLLAIGLVAPSTAALAKSHHRHGKPDVAVAMAVVAAAPTGVTSNDQTGSDPDPNAPCAVDSNGEQTGDCQDSQYSGGSQDSGGGSEDNGGGGGEH